MLDLLMQHPVVTPAFVAAKLEVTATTAGTMLSRAQDLGLVEERTGKQRNRVFRYDPLLELFDSE